MKAKITKQDLKKALSQPWSMGSCLIAQFAKRNGMEHFTDVTTKSDEAYELMEVFDQGHNPRLHGITPEEAEMNLQLLELVLPMEIEY